MVWGIFRTFAPPKTFSNNTENMTQKFEEGTYRGYCTFMKKTYEGKLYIKGDKTYIVLDCDMSNGTPLPEGKYHAVLCTDIEKIAD